MTLSDVQIHPISYSDPLSDNMQAIKSTPFLTVDLDIIREKFRILSNFLPSATCFYSVKSSPLDPIITTLLSEGANFEAASIGEIEQCISLGVSPSNIHYGNSVKAQSSIDKAVDLGISSFAFDSMEELLKLHTSFAKGATLICRITTDGKGATWGLCNKFGCDVGQAINLLRFAADLGDYNLGISFHVGSQQTNPEAWERALSDVCSIIDTLALDGICISIINIGGGFPVSGYLNAEHSLVSFDIPSYLTDIEKMLLSIKQRYSVIFICEPGRYILSEAGVLSSSVILATERHFQGRSCRWLYLDIGKFNGLYEATDIVHPIETTTGKGSLVDTVLTGPSCDSDDMLMCGANFYQLPSDIAIGDTINVHRTGAYSASYATIGFNGFRPLDVYYKNR